jgi:hypothetical protein
MPVGLSKMLLQLSAIHRSKDILEIIEHWNPLNAARRRMIRIDGRSLGNGTAFSAVAPSQRPVCDAHQSKIFESGISIMSPGPEYLDA